MHIKKYFEIQNKIPIMTGKMKVGGEFRLVLMNSMGGVVQDTGWFPNLITNGGLTYLHSQNWSGYCHIGQSSTAPAFTDSALLNWLARHDTIQSVVEGPAPVAPNYEWYETRGYRFNAGNGVGTVREVGLGHVFANSNLTIRSLVSPAVPKAADQVLDVYYRFKLWPSTADVLGTTMIAAEDFNYKIRGMELDYPSGMQTFMAIRFPTSGSGAYCWQDDIAALTAAPSVASGASASHNAETHPALIGASGVDTGAGTGYIDTIYKWALDEANSAGGIRSISARMLSSGTPKGVQCQFNRVSDGTGKIMKNNTKELTVTFRMMYAR